MAFGARRLWPLLIAFVLIVAAPADAGETAAGLERSRPAALVPLYLTFAGLQALDAHSTLQATAAGARETNPLVRGSLDSPARLLLMKSATAAGVVVLTEKLWRRNRTAAVVSMIALNSAYLTIAAHNYRQTR